MTDDPARPAIPALRARRAAVALAGKGEPDAHLRRDGARRVRIEGVPLGRAAAQPKPMSKTPRCDRRCASG